MSDTAIQPLCDLLPIERVARTVAPISDHIEHRYFDGGVIHVLNMLSEYDIEVEADSEPPSPPYEVPTPPLTRQWFAAIQHHRSGADYHRIAEWSRVFLDWVRASLKVSRAGIVANLSSPSGRFHAPIENVDTAGASWSFPQALAWIATREAIEVARMQYSRHFGPPMEDAQPGLRAMTQSDSGRRLLIGWLVLRTSLDHCNCGSAATIEREPWEACECVGRAYDELRAFAKGTAHPIPEYQPKPAYASFTLTWPDGAHDLRFTRAEVIARWPQQALGSPLRSPAVKEGRPPSVDDILVKADEMKSRGMNGYTIAKDMRHQQGFENVATTEVRGLIKGRWKPGGRPPKKGA